MAYDFGSGDATAQIRLVFPMVNGLTIVLVWRLVCLYVPHLQQKIHRLWRPLRPLCQWYILMTICLTGLMFFTMWEIYCHDYTRSDWLDPTKVNATLALKYSALNYTDDEIAVKQDQFYIAPWLRWMSLASPFAACIAFAVLLFQLVDNVVQGWRFRELDDDAKTLGWEVSQRQDMVLLVVLLPASFIIMSARSTSRMWMIMSGYHYHDADVARDVALFMENFEVASILQYYTVFVFSELCMTFLRTAHKDIENILHLAGFQGVYCYVLFGCVQAVLIFVTAYLGAHPDSIYMFVDKDKITITKLMEELTSATATVTNIASVMTLLCVYNMFVICRATLINKKLPRSSLKFLATRLLLLVSQIQLKAIMMCSETKNSTLSTISQSDMVYDHVALVRKLHLNQWSGMLLHSTLLSYECLIVVLLNFYFWKCDLNLDAIMGKSLETLDALLLGRSET